MEIEAKYAVLDERAYTALTRLHQIAGFPVEEGETRTVLDTYEDTQNHDLLTAGYACRRRREDGKTYLTLKGLDTSGTESSAIHHRTELELPIAEDIRRSPDRWPESPIRDLVLENSQGKELVDILNIEQVRQIRYLRSAQGDLIAELSLDDVKIRGANKTQTFIELEVEVLEAGSESDLQQITTHLSAMEGLTVQPTSKFARGLAFVAVSTRKKGKAAAINDGDTMGEAAFAILRPLFLKMLMHEQDTYSGEDLEALHDMRVATRRMRTFLRVTGPHLDSNALEPVSDGLRKTARILGAVRDMDVFRQKTEQYLAESGTPSAALHPLIEVWNVEYARRRNDMLAHLSSRGYGRFKQAFWALLENGLPDRKVPVRVGEAVRRLVSAQLLQLQGSTAVEQAVRDYEAYHQVRIDGKYLRYSLEFFRTLLGPEALEAIQVLKRLQDSFGDLQDAVVAVRHLRAVTAYGTWEVPKQSKRLWAVPNGSASRVPRSTDAVWDYLRTREAEIETLTAGAAQAWREFRDQGVADLVEAALRIGYHEDTGQSTPARPKLSRDKEKL